MSLNCRRKFQQGFWPVPEFAGMAGSCLLALALSGLQNLAAQHCPAAETLKKCGLVEIRKEIPGTQVDLRYSSTRNFTGIDLYGCLSEAYGRVELVAKLKAAAALLHSRKPGYRLLIFDAARPLSAQQALWNAIQLPESRKHIYVADPKKGSIHNYGCAVDISLVNEKGIPLDMGTDFDFFGELAQPRCEQKMLHAGRLDKHQLANRKLLRSCMKQAGFTGTTSEWWHFNACSLSQAKKQFSIIP